jgi:glycosyltransferase involved in cell wall biosynthesis
MEKMLTSLLSQDPGAAEMQIEVIDDASTIDPEPLVRRVAGERISFVRNLRNLGYARNFNRCVERSRGHWVHILHTDDYVLPGFYERLRAAIATGSEVGAAFCRPAWVHGEDQRLCEGILERSTPGILSDFIEKIGVCQRLAFSTVVVRRSVYETLGGYLPELWTTDWQMWIRIAARYPIWYEPAALVACRIHDEAGTAGAIRACTAVPDLRRCIEISHPLLPPDRADAISRDARRWVFVQALDFARDSLAKNEFTAALSHVWQGLRCSPSPRLVKRLLSLLARCAKAGLRRPARAAQPAHTTPRGTLGRLKDDELAH